MSRRPSRCSTRSRPCARRGEYGDTCCRQLVVFVTISRARPTTSPTTRRKDKVAAVIRGNNVAHMLIKPPARAAPTCCRLRAFTFWNCLSPLRFARRPRQQQVALGPPVRPTCCLARRMRHDRLIVGRNGRVDPSLEVARGSSSWDWSATSVLVVLPLPAELAELETGELVVEASNRLLGRESCCCVADVCLVSLPCCGFRSGRGDTCCTRPVGSIGRSLVGPTPVGAGVTPATDPAAVHYSAGAASAPLPATHSARWSGWRQPFNCDGEAATSGPAAANFSFSSHSECPHWQTRPAGRTDRLHHQLKRSSAASDSI